MRTIIIITLLAGTLFGQTTGTWKMNPDKSKHDDPEPFPQSFVMRIEPHLEGEAITLWRVTQDGRSETDSFIQRFDGKDYPFPREERFDSFNARKLADGTIESVFKKDGKVVYRQTRQLTADGEQMTIEYQLLLSATGRWLDRVLVLEKQKE
jgi:hypothetical protein